MEIKKKHDNHCSFCGVKYKHKSRLEEHMRKHTRERPFYCDKCQRGFSSKNYLSGHIRRQHQQELSSGKKENLHKCSLCPFTTQWKCSFERHISATHTGERSFPCRHPGCEFATKSSYLLQLHVTYRHKNERKFSCPVPNCDYRGKTMINVRLHSTKHSEDKPFVCDFEGCNYRAKMKVALAAHKRGVHCGGNKPFACSVCDYRAPTKEHLAQHRVKHQEKSVKCGFKGCTIFCKSQSRLKRHILNCHSERKLKCVFTDCLFTTASQAMLTRHEIRVHSEKVHKCSRCDYRASCPSYLKHHIQKRHSNAIRQRIDCPNKGCTFQAWNQTFLKRHLKFHDQNLSCFVEGCGYVGTSISSIIWKRHLRTHDPTGRPFHCPLCPKHFFNNSNLSRHVSQHTEEKPFKCPACNFGTASKTGIMRHVYVFHPIVFPDCVYDQETICDCCGVNYGCTAGLAMHRIKLKTAIVVLTRLRIKRET